MIPMFLYEINVCSRYVGDIPADKIYESSSGQQWNSIEGTALLTTYEQVYPATPSISQSLLKELFSTGH